jgi:Mrp family chromosome partitioning ATPase
MLLRSKILSGGDELVPSTSLSGYLAKLRREFEYSIVEGPPAGESSEAAALGRSADGIILVLEAHRTRRAAARKIKETLDAADVRVLGMVLTGRRFPIPEGIYRRL